jgi:hypothetical protein
VAAPLQLIYYSVNTKLAYLINERFYNKHYVWCAPVFNSSKLEDMHIYKSIPPSSNPFDIYQRYKADVARADKHSSYIGQNKAGLKNGAIRMLGNNTIDAADFERINAIIDNAELDKFSPLLYLIPKVVIEPRIVTVGVTEAANPLSFEFQVHDLRKNEFEILEF